MHFLLVNDDGIGSVGIMALMEAALKRGHRVSMCAPSGQMSAASHRITLSDPLYVKDYPLNRENAQGFAITGTPADCVRLAFLGGLVTEPVDGVISGVNNGYNAGLAVYYSGTVGAAREAALLGHPSIAASIDYKADPAHVQDAAELVLEVAEKYFRAPKNGFRVLNINVPDLPRANSRRERTLAICNSLGLRTSMSSRAAWRARFPRNLVGSLAVIFRGAVLNPGGRAAVPSRRACSRAEPGPRPPGPGRNGR